MAALAPTSSQVKESSAAGLLTAFATVEIKAGDVIVLVSDRWAKTQPEFGAGWNIGDTVGIALNHAYANQPLTGVIEDPALDLGVDANVVSGVVYCVGYAVLGTIIPSTDVGAGHRRVVLGVGYSTGTGSETRLHLKAMAGGAV